MRDVIEAVILLVAIVIAFRLLVAHRQLTEQLGSIRAELHARLDRLDKRQDRLARSLSDLEERGIVAAAPAVVAPAQAVVEAATAGESVEPPPSDAAAAPVDDAPVTPPTLEPPTPPREVAPGPEQRFEWERFIGLRLPVWLGAIALCIAGFFFVSYAIDSGFFTPVMRVLSAATAALAFLVGAETVRRRVTTGNVAAIASALGAAAIATAYATAFLATITYGLLPSGAGFIATVGVSLLAIAIALAYGQMVALVGIVGGYAAPVVYGGGAPSAPFLAIYLLALTAAAFAVIRYKSWWRLSIVGLLGPAVWGLIWALSPELLAAPFWSDAFLIAVPLIVGFASLPGWRADGPIVGFSGTSGVTTPQRATLVTSMVLSVIGFVLFLVAADFALGLWRGLIALGLLAVVAGFVSPPHRGLQLPVLIGASVALLLWPASDDTAALVVIGILAVVFGFGALDQFRRLREPALWAGVLAFVALYLFAMALFKVTSWPSALEQKHAWALGALALAAAFVALLRYFAARLAPELVRSSVYAAWGGTVTTLVSLALALEIDPLYFPASSAIAVLGLAGVHWRVPVRGLRILAAVYTVLYLMLIAGGVSLLAAVFGPLTYLLVPDIAGHALILLVLPGLALLIAATLFHAAAREPSANLVALLDIVGVASLAWGLQQLLVPNEFSWPASMTLTVAAKLATPELLLAAAAIYLGRRTGRPMAYAMGLGLTGLVGLLLLAFLIAPLLRFWPDFAVPGPAIVNIAALAYGLPALVLFWIGWYLRQEEPKRPTLPTGPIISVFAVAMVYALLLVDIRQAYHLGAPSLSGDTSQSEFYAYSIGTLVFGLTLLVVGVVFRHRGARALSFIFVLAATIKVFLFDAAALSGLWRVLSFLLMGLSFLGISWAYARFVFGIGVRRSMPPPLEPPATAPPPEQ